MISIIGTGLSGLVGSRIVQLLKSQYLFEDMSRKTGIDITNKDEVIRKIASSSSPMVFHFAAKTDVDDCENEISLGEQSFAWKVNVEGTRNITQACESAGKKLVYISTDMVFDGNKPLGEKYSEEDTPKPVNWYAETKYHGEKIVQKAKIPWIILRIAYPYRAKFEKKEYVRIFLSLLQSNQEILAVSDQFFTPTFIDDLANVLNFFIVKEITGIYHAVGSKTISPYDAALTVARKFQLNEDLVKETTRDEYFNDRALRPFNLALKNDKIQKLGLKMTDFDQGIDEIKKLLNSL